MSPTTIDLRSDTVTQPTVAMRRAMSEAEVGDDVLGADPTAARLEREIARILGKEAALFMPSGTMTNQVAIRLHCRPGDEFLCESDCHIYNYEQGAFAQLSGVVAHTVSGTDGVLRLDSLKSLIRPDNDHLVRTRLICLENTHNRGGGTVLPREDVERIGSWAHATGIGMHLDGARLFNAVVASGIDAATLAAPFDTVSVCFSKGLGAPVGSALMGSSEMIREARRHRKLFGGGMRQCGVIAAGALFALQYHVDRLADDHENAKRLAAYVPDAKGLKLSHGSVDTNIVFFDVDPRMGTAQDFIAGLQQEDVMMLTESEHRVRALTHLDVSRSDIERAGEILQRVASRLAESLV